MVEENSVTDRHVSKETVIRNYEKRKSDVSASFNLRTQTNQVNYENAIQLEIVLVQKMYAITDITRYLGT